LLGGGGGGRRQAAALLSLDAPLNTNLSISAALETYK
jgi:hypothetical protein